MLLGMFASRVPNDTPLPGFFSSDLILTPGWEPVTGPTGFYESGANKTYVAWQFVGLAGYKGVHVAAYDHATNTWGERYTAGNFLLANDDHGHPALVRDADGYIHCFFGSHLTTQKWSVTNSPDDISAWTQQGDLGSALTYPKAALVGSKLYLFVRDGTTGSNQALKYSTLTPTAGTGSWAALKNIVDYTGTTRSIYASEIHVRGTDIHFACCTSNSTATKRQNIYYYILDTTTGNVTNYNGTTTVLSASLPVTITQSDANFRIFNHGTNDGDMPSLQFDTSGNAHVIFADGVTPTYDLKHMMLSGGSWSSATTIATLADIEASTGYVGTYYLTPGASGKMEAWYNIAGDKVRRVRTSGGAWSSPQVVETATAFDFVGGASISTPHADLRTVFSRSAVWTTDADAALVELYGYGDSGQMTDQIPMAAVDTAGWSNVVLLMGANHRNNATTIIDESKSAVRATFNGNAKIDTTQSPFAGKASLRLDGTGDYVSIPSDAAYSVAGTGDFCIDLFVRLNELGRLQTIISKRPTGTNNEWALYLSAANQLQFLLYNGSGSVLNITGSSTLTTGTWYHVEVSRISSVTRMFRAGALEASGTQSSAPTSGNGAVLIGRDVSNTARDFNGWLADIRFTRAGRHSSAFTAPTTPFPRR